MVARSKRRKQRTEPAAPAPAPSAALLRSYAVPCALLFLGVFLLYAGSYRYPLVFDDKIINLVELPDMASSCATLKRRCVSYSTFGLSYLAAGFDLFWFRAGNVLCHALAALACFFFLDRLFDAVRRSEPQGPGELSAGKFRLLAYCGAVLFALHPVTVYGVAYLAQRSIVMATLFSLLSLAAFVRALADGDRRWLWLAVVLYVLAVWSKEHAVMLPAVALAIAVLLGRRLPGRRLELIVIIAAIAGAAALIAYRLEFVIGAAYESYIRELGGFGEGAAKPDPAGVYRGSVVTQMFLFFKYVLLWLLPYPGWMSVDLREPVASRLLAWPQALGAIAFLAYGMAAAVLLCRRGTLGLLGFGLLFPWLLFFTEFVTIRVQEPLVLYRSYLWMAAMPAVLPFLAQRLSARAIIAGCAALALIYAVAMRERLHTFSSELALWNDAIRKSTDLSLPFVDRAYTGRGSALLREGRVDEALSDLDTAMKLNPRSPYTHLNRAMALSRKGERLTALAGFDRAIELNPSFPEAYSERCLLLIRMEQPDRALESCNSALRLAPALPTALLNRAVLHMRASRLDRALADVEGVLKFEPGSAIALYNRGRIYRGLGRAAESERDLRASCKAGLRAACDALR